MTEDFLSPGHFVDSDAPAIRACAERVCADRESDTERAVAVFEFVRDEIEYEFEIRLTPEAYKSSAVLEDGRGFCVRKAVLLAALGRAAGVPTAIVLCDMRDGTLPKKVVEVLGTGVMHHHGLNAFCLNGRWLKVDATLSPGLVERFGFRTAKFDGKSDALQAETTLAGEPHIEYEKFHGRYADLPYQEMVQGMQAGYRNADAAGMNAMGMRDPRDFVL